MRPLSKTNFVMAFSGALTLETNVRQSETANHSEENNFAYNPPYHQWLTSLVIANIVISVIHPDLIIYLLLVVSYNSLTVSSQKSVFFQYRCFYTCMFSLIPKIELGKLVVT